MKTILEIQNLKCGGCQNTIYKRLSQLPEITNVFINQDTATVEFNYTTEMDLNNVQIALSNLGYPVVGTENTLTKKAKSYVSCAIGRVQK